MRMSFIQHMNETYVAYSSKDEVEIKEVYQLILNNKELYPLDFERMTKCLNYTVQFKNQK